MHIVAGHGCGLTGTQIADKELSRSRRQQKLDKGASSIGEHVSAMEENSLKRKREDVERDPKLKEFLDVMQPPSKQRAWANEEAQMESQPVPAFDVAADVDAEGESDGEYQVLAKKSQVVVHEPQHPVEPVVEAQPHKQSIASQQHQVDDGEVCQGAPVQSVSGPVSDADWLRSRTNRVLDLVESDHEMSQSAEHESHQKAIQAPAHDRIDGPDETTEDAVQQEAGTTTEEDRVRQTGRLFLRNLHFDVTENDLRNHFVGYGSLDEVGYCHSSFKAAT